MLNYPVFEEKNRPLFRLHYSVIAGLHLYLLVFALAFSHPAYLSALLLAETVMFYATQTWPTGKLYLKMAVPLLIMVIFLNLVFSRAGTTLLWDKPWGWGDGSWTLPFTLEALAYGAVMALRLAVIISSCASFFAVTSPARMLKMMSVLGYRWALTMNLTLRLVPLMMEEYARIAEVQRCRGIAPSGGWMARLQGLLPSSSILLLSSLERSVEMAESMYARGFGSGPRQCFDQETWRWNSTAAVISLLLASGLSLAAVIAGWGVLKYYPVLPSMDGGQMVPALVIALLVAAPSLGKGGDENVSHQDQAA